MGTPWTAETGLAAPRSGPLLAPTQLSIVPRVKKEKSDGRVRTVRGDLAERLKIVEID